MVAPSMPPEQRSSSDSRFAGPRIEFCQPPQAIFAKNILRRPGARILFATKSPVPQVISYQEAAGLNDRDKSPSPDPLVWWRDWVNNYQLHRQVEEWLTGLPEATLTSIVVNHDLTTLTITQAAIECAWQRIVHSANQRGASIQVSELAAEVDNQHGSGMAFTPHLKYSLDNVWVQTGTICKSSMDCDHLRRLSACLPVFGKVEHSNGLLDIKAIQIGHTEYFSQQGWRRLPGTHSDNFRSKNWWPSYKEAILEHVESEVSAHNDKVAVWLSAHVANEITTNSGTVIRKDGYLKWFVDIRDELDCLEKMAESM